MMRRVLILFGLLAALALAGCSSLFPIPTVAPSPTIELPFPIPGQEQATPAAPAEIVPTEAAAVEVETQEAATEEATELPAAADSSETYPAAPEEVVQAFLLAAQQTPDQMAQYLASSVEIPAGGPIKLLNISGSLKSFELLSGSVNPDPPAASIKVQITVGSKTGQRTFILTQTDDKWVITKIVK